MNATAIPWKDQPPTRDMLDEIAQLRKATGSEGSVIPETKHRASVMRSLLRRKAREMGLDAPAGNKSAGKPKPKQNRSKSPTWKDQPVSDQQWTEIKRLRKILDLNENTKPDNRKAAANLIYRLKKRTVSALDDTPALTGSQQASHGSNKEACIVPGCSGTVTARNGHYCAQCKAKRERGEIPPYRKIAYAPRICRKPNCDVEYKPTAANQKYCPDCSTSNQPKAPKKEAQPKQRECLICRTPYEPKNDDQLTCSKKCGLRLSGIARSLHARDRRREERKNPPPQEQEAKPLELETAEQIRTRTQELCKVASAPYLQAISEAINAAVTDLSYGCLVTIPNAKESVLQIVEDELDAKGITADVVLTNKEATIELDWSPYCPKKAAAEEPQTEAEPEPPAEPMAESSLPSA